jgi:hypothetical protein
MRLTLNKETLVELSQTELGNVLGAAATVKTICDRPTLRVTCGSEVDACLTAQACTL